MVTFLCKWTTCLSVLVMVSQDTAECHQAEVKWANAIIKVTSGVSGFHRLSSFSCEADFFANNSHVVKIHDKDSRNISVSQADLEDALERSEALFGEGLTYGAEPNASYTWRFMQGDWVVLLS